MTKIIDNIAKEFYVGKTHIKICTDYCVKNTEEINDIIHRIAETSFNELIHLQIKKHY